MNDLYINDDYFPVFLESKNTFRCVLEVCHDTMAVLELLQDITNARFSCEWVFRGCTDFPAHDDDHPHGRGSSTIPSPPPGARALSLFMAMLFLASLSNSQHSASVTFCHFTCFILCLIPELNTTLFPHQFDQSLLHVWSSYRCSSSSPSSSSLASLLPTEFSPFLHKQGN